MTAKRFARIDANDTEGHKMTETSKQKIDAADAKPRTTEGIHDGTP